MKTVISHNAGMTSYFYDAVSNRDSVANANGTAVGYHYDNLNRLVNVTNFNGGAAISSYTYTLNNAGIRTAVDELDGSHVAYGYDSLYRLTSEVRTGTHAFAITYVYDDVGNRQSQTKDGQMTTYIYNNRDQLVSETGPSGLTSYTYDHAGRMTSKTDVNGTTSYSWIDNDRMTSVSGPGVLATYDYDASGQRVGETSGAAIKRYLIDYQLPYGQVIAETDGNGSLVASYVFGQDRISMTRGASTHTYIADGQGSIRQLTNQAGLVTDTYDYTAFGEELAHTGTTVNPFRYVGEAFDPNAGFYYNRARWYDPQHGTFTSVDPWAGDAMAVASLHRYLYANSSPVSFVDPTGRFTLAELKWVIVIAGIMATVVECAKPGKIGWSSDGNVTWSASRLAEFQTFVKGRIPSYMNTRFDCTSFFLQFLVDFAYSKNYRLIVKRDKEIIDSDKKYPNGKLGFEHRVSHVMAIHMPDNTYVIERSEIGSGDIFSYTTGGNHHTRMIISIDGDNVVCWQAPAINTTPEMIEDTYDDFIVRPTNGAQATGGGARRWHQFSK